MKITIIVVIILLIFNLAKSQSVAINTDGSTANTSSILDIKSTTKGVLVPRMSKTEKNAIATPATGLLVYQNTPDSIGFHYYNGIIWVWLQPSANGWDINGNNNILPSNFLGTINNQGLKFRVNNSVAGEIDSAKKNTSIGYQSLLNNTTGFNNTAIGFDAGRSLTVGYGNAILGHKALSNTFNGSENIAIGDSAMGNAINSSSNTAVGYHALKNLDGQVSQSINTAIGYRSQSAQTGTTPGFVSFYNSSVGGFALHSNVTGSSNVAIGFNAMRNSDSSSGNVAIGRSALRDNKRTDLAQNVALGSYALSNDSSSNWNIAIGGDAMTSANNSSLNAAIGFRALKLIKAGGENNALGVGTMEYKDTALACIAIGRFALAGHETNNNLPDTGSIGIGRWAGRYNNASENTFMGYYTASANPITGKDNIGIGSYTLRYLNQGSKNVAIGSNAGGQTFTGSRNVFLGNQAGSSTSAGNSDRLFIENSNADSSAALIYGNFEADSLVLNANVNVRDFTRLGAESSGAPAIKMKKIVSTNGAAGALTSFNHGLTQSKILSVSVFINATSSNDIAPRSTYSGFEYDYFVSSTAVHIRNISGNDGGIVGRPVRILITYEE